MIIFLILIPILAFWLWLGYLCFIRSCKRRPSDSEERNDFCGGKEIPEAAKTLLFSSREWVDTAPFEEVRVSSRDGLTLYGRLLPPRDASRGIVLFAHGFHSSCRRDLAIQAKAVYDKGYGILLIYQRGHGKSEGKHLCLGVKERYDILCWCSLLCDRFGDIPIALMGLSMGGATVMMASELELPKNVKCIVDDCGFTSPFEITANTLRYKHHIIPYPTVFFMDIWCRLIAHFGLCDTSAPSALKKNTRPLLIIHGERDLYVPTKMSIKNSAVNEELTTLMIVPEAKHAQSVYYDTDGYIDTLLKFLEANM